MKTPSFRASTDGGALARHRSVSGRFVIRATHERGVGVPSSRSFATASREASSVYARPPTARASLSTRPHGCQMAELPRWQEYDLIVKLNDAARLLIGSEPATLVTTNRDGSPQ